MNMKKTDVIVKTADDKLARDIKVVDIDQKAGICDQFIIMTGRNKNHTQALADYIEQALEKEGLGPVRVEGFRDGGWILIDGEEVIVHIFTADQREFYKLEELWKTGEVSAETQEEE